MVPLLSLSLIALSSYSIILIITLFYDKFVLYCIGLAIFSKSRFIALSLRLILWSCIFYRFFWFVKTFKLLITFLLILVIRFLISTRYLLVCFDYFSLFIIILVIDDNELLSVNVTIINKFICSNFI